MDDNGGTGPQETFKTERNTKDQKNISYYHEEIKNRNKDRSRAQHDHSVSAGVGQNY